MDKVSKLKGLRIKVMGNSLTISTKINIAAANTEDLIHGRVILNAVFVCEWPKVLLASNKFLGILENPETVAPNGIA